MDITKMKQVAWIGEQYLKGPIRGVVLVFHGLGYMGEKNGVDTTELEWANNGFLVVFPYYGPWSWMNREARIFVDDLVDAVYTNYSLSEEIPLISTGGSMGGYSSLLYTCYAKRPVAKCLALFPVCDLKAHFNERPDLPRSIHHAFCGYKEDMEILFIEHSPVHQISKMPDIPYLIIHGDQDEVVNKKLHSDSMVQKMAERNLNVNYIQVEGMGHGTAMPLYVLTSMIDFVNEERTSSSSSHKTRDD